MKKIGLIGGLGPEATIDYYRIIVKLFREKVRHFPELIINSVDLKKYAQMLDTDRLAEQIEWLVDAVNILHQASADFAVITSNTPHIVFDEIQTRSPIPIISIVEVTCNKAEELRLARVGLMGTRTTMGSDFYQKVFLKAGIEIIVPNENEQNYIHEKLVKEIIKGKILDETREGLLKIVKRMVDEDGIDGLILGCTELPLILTRGEFGIPFLNTTRLHAEAAVRYALGDE
ncbi:MAG TPA: amino acid racemase [bacterium (Candidatus Stahlbacteria)]|nr:amino acid racemase [Candidatus Stahlbacteria bacterium]